MFGHDMSWASFHVLEVMSSAKYLQKRVGYLSAVQSFRPDTEVLMLATNLLKKVNMLRCCDEVLEELLKPA
jgi:AP-3 complex subunit delta